MVSYSEPTWTTPYRVCDPNLSEMTPRTPSIVAAGVLSILRNHFGSEERIMDRRLKDHLWHPDRKRCKLLIEPTVTYEPTIAGRKPCIIVDNGNMRVSNVAMGGRVTPHVDSDGVFRGKDRIFNTSGELTFIVLAPKPLQSQMIAEEAALNIAIFGQEYSDSLSLGDLTLAGIDPVRTQSQEQGQAVRGYMSSVTLRWVAVQSWTVSTRGPLLRRGGLSLPF